MSKLIIRHGERVTEHLVDDHALVVGRDPQCDLFFADKKLSRRHARFELVEDGIRLVDLGSRNGCWVNEERVEDKLLTPSDAIRLGGLSITLETEPKPTARDGQESTVFLSTEPSADDSRTVVLSGDDLPDAEPAPQTGTAILSAEEMAGAEPGSETRLAPVGEPVGDPIGDEDPTLRKPDYVSREDNAERTVLLDGVARESADTGTVILRGHAVPSAEDATRLAPAPSTDTPAAMDEVQTRTEVPEADPLPEVAMALTEDVNAIAIATDDDDEEWAPAPSVRVTPPSTLRFVVLVAAVAALAFVVLAIPLLRTLGSALTAESSLRGRALVDLLAATNEEALRENRSEALALQRVAGEPGVIGAYILDPMGRVLAPTGMSGDSSTPFLASLGVDADAKDIRSFRESRAGDGSTVYAVPVRAEGRRLGVAVLHYRTGAALSSWTAVMLVLGSLLLLMGVAAAVLMARRWTLLPVQELRDDVEALRRGFVASLVEDRPYSDLATIARSFNEMVQQSGGAPSDGGAETYKPVVDPTLVPEEREQAEG